MKEGDQGCPRGREAERPPLTSLQAREPGRPPSPPRTTTAQVAATGSEGRRTLPVPSCSSPPSYSPVLSPQHPCLLSLLWLRICWRMAGTKRGWLDPCAASQICLVVVVVSLGSDGSSCSAWPPCPDGLGSATQGSRRCGSCTGYGFAGMGYWAWARWPNPVGALAWRTCHPRVAVVSASIVP